MYLAVPIIMGTRSRIFTKCVRRRRSRVKSSTTGPLIFGVTRRVREAVSRTPSSKHRCLRQCLPFDRNDRGDCRVHEYYYRHPQLCGGSAGFRQDEDDDERWCGSGDDVPEQQCAVPGDDVLLVTATIMLAQLAYTPNFCFFLGGGLYKC